jgi:hypothetical protein
MLTFALIILRAVASVISDDGITKTFTEEITCQQFDTADYNATESVVLLEQNESSQLAKSFNEAA